MSDQISDVIKSERIPAAPVRNTVVGLAGTLAHARKYTWAEQAGVSGLLARLDALVSELAGQLPENQPGYHGEGELADFDPGTGRSSWDDWG